MVTNVQSVKNLQREIDLLNRAIDLPCSKPPKRIVAHKIEATLKQAAFVSIASDWHVEERVLKSDTQLGVSYSLGIAKHRIENYFQGVVEFVELMRHGHVITSGVIGLLGDMMTGHIHDELVETTQLSPTETILWLEPLIVSGLEYVVSALDLDRLVVPCTYGNHGRTTEKRRITTGHRHSYEWLMYRHLAGHFNGHPVVNIHAPPSHDAYVSVYGKRLHFQHGEDIKTGGTPGLSVISAHRMAEKWDRVKPSFIHHTGHTHTRFDYQNVVGNGSLIGPNRYSESHGYAPEAPMQTIYLLNPRRGKTISSPIMV